MLGTSREGSPALPARAYQIASCNWLQWYDGRCCEPGAPFRSQKHYHQISTNNSTAKMPGLFNSFTTLKAIASFSKYFFGNIGRAYLVIQQVQPCYQKPYLQVDKAHFTIIIHCNNYCDLFFNVYHFFQYRRASNPLRDHLLVFITSTPRPS